MFTSIKIPALFLIFACIVFPLGLLAHDHDTTDMNHGEMEMGTSSDHMDMNGSPMMTAESSLSLFKYTARIHTKGKAGMLEAILPTEHTSKITAEDIKIISTDAQKAKQEVPFLLLDGDYVDPFHSMASNLKNTASKNGGIETVIDVSDIGMQHYGIYLEIPEYIFPTQSIAVYGSDTLLPIDSPAWSEHELQKGGIIYSYIDSVTGQQIRKNTVEYMITKQRYLKLIAKPVSAEQTAAMASAGIKPFKIAGGLIQAIPSRYTVREVRVSDIIPKNVQILPKPDEKKTEILIDIGKENMYTHGFDLATSSSGQKFIYWYLVESSNDNVTWKPESEGNIFNISDDTFADSDMRIKYPEIRARYLRVSIYDNAVGAFSKKITLKSNVRSLIFEAEEGKTYDVYIGNTASQPMIYDSALLKSYGVASTSEVSIGKLGDQTSSKPNILWSTIGAALIIILYFLLRRRRLSH